MVAALTVTAVALAALAGYAYSRPAGETVTVPDAYEQTGSFGYRAAARAGAAYPDGVVRTGEAVFPRLSRQVEMSFDYRVISNEKTDLTGRGGLTAVVADGLGWSRAIPLGPDRAFRGGAATLTGNLRLDRLRSVVRAFERETGTKATGYAVDITPRVSIEGEVGGSPVSSVLSPSFALRLDGTRLALGSSPTGEPVDLVARRNGGITSPANASLSLAGVAPPIYQARAIGLLGLEIAFGAALLLALPMIMAARRSEAGAIRMRMGRRLVDVADLPTSAPGGCIDLERMSDLARVADRADVPIMVAETATRARCAVVWGNVLYRYTTRPVAATPRPGSGAGGRPGMRGSGVPGGILIRAARALAAFRVHRRDQRRSDRHQRPPPDRDRPGRPGRHGRLPEARRLRGPLPLRCRLGQRDGLGHRRRRSGHGRPRRGHHHGPRRRRLRDGRRWRRRHRRRAGRGRLHRRPRRRRLHRLRDADPVTVGRQALAPPCGETGSAGPRERVVVSVEDRLRHAAVSGPDTRRPG